MAHGLSCSAACEIRIKDGTPLHWQAHSLPLRHQEIPESYFSLVVQMMPRKTLIHIKHPSIEIIVENKNRELTNLSWTQGFLRSSNGKEPACSAGDPGSSLGQEDPLEKGLATHSGILVCRIPSEDTGRLQSMGSQRVRHN